MSKLPAIQFYPGDWRKDPGVQALSFHDRGVWFEIILLMHESDERGKLLLNGKPMPETALARLLGLDNQNLTNTLTTLLEFGVASRCEETGAIICRRMIRDENLRNIRKEAGKKGGNPALVKQKTTTVVKQKRTPSSSTSLKMRDCESEQSQVDQCSVILSEFNSGFGMQCRITPARRKTLLARLKDDWWSDHWKEAIEIGSKSPFLRGENDRGWKIDFEFFLKPETVTKIMEGKYSPVQPKKKDPFPFDLNNPASKAELEKLFLDGLHT